MAKEKNTEGIPKWAKTLCYISTTLIVAVAPFITQIIIEDMRIQAGLKKVEVSSVPKDFQEEQPTMAGDISQTKSAKKIMEAL